MTDQKTLQMYVHEIVVLNAEIVSLKQQLTDAQARIEDLAQKFGATCYTCGRDLVPGEQRSDGEFVRCATCYDLCAWTLEDFNKVWQEWQRTGSHNWVNIYTKTLLDGKYITWNEWCMLAHDGQGMMEDDE